MQSPRGVPVLAAGGEWCVGRKVRSMVAAVAEAIGSSKLHKQILGDTPSKREVLNRVQEEGVEFVDLQFTDVMGIVKSVTIPSGIFGHVIDGGQWIDGSSIAGFTRIAESDMYLTRGPVHLRGHSLDPGRAHHRPRHLLGLQPEWRSLPRRSARRPAAPAGTTGRARLHVQDRPGAGVLPLREGWATRSHRCPTTAPATSTSRPTSPTPSARTW